MIALVLLSMLVMMFGGDGGASVGGSRFCWWVLVVFVLGLLFAIGVGACTGVGGVGC